MSNKACQKKSHRLISPAKVSSGAIDWPSFGGPASFLGKSSLGVSVYHDASLGTMCLKNAQDLLADADRIQTANGLLFAAKPMPVNVIVFALGGATDGTGGADHDSCDYETGANIEVCASFGQSNRCSALFEAELSECNMGGNLCGYSTGEALSRWCSMVTSPHALDDFASAPAWQQGGSPNWIDKLEHTDQDYMSIGCGMAFLSWLLKGGITLPQIAQAMVANGEDSTFATLGGSLLHLTASTIWPAFIRACNTLTIASDDPFGP